MASTVIGNARYIFLSRTDVPYARNWLCVQQTKYFDLDNGILGALSGSCVNKICVRAGEKEALCRFGVTARRVQRRRFPFQRDLVQLPSLKDGRDTAFQSLKVKKPSFGENALKVLLFFSRFSNYSKDNLSNTDLQFLSETVCPL